MSSTSADSNQDQLTPTKTWVTNDSDIKFDQIANGLPNVLLYHMWRYVILENFNTSQILDLYNQSEEANYILRLILINSRFNFHFKKVDPYDERSKVTITLKTSSHELKVTRKQLEFVYEIFNLMNIKGKRATIDLTDPNYEEEDIFGKLNSFFLRRNFESVEFMVRLEMFNFIQRIIDRSIETSKPFSDIIHKLTLYSFTYIEGYNVALKFPNLFSLIFILRRSSKIMNKKPSSEFKEWLNEPLRGRKKKLIFVICNGVVLHDTFIQLFESLDKDSIELEIRLVSKFVSYLHRDSIHDGEYIHEHSFRSKFQNIRDHITLLTYHIPFETLETILFVNSCTQLKVLNVNSSLSRQESILNRKIEGSSNESSDESSSDESSDVSLSFEESSEESTDGYESGYDSNGDSYFEKADKKPVLEPPTSYNLRISFIYMTKLEHLNLSYCNLNPYTFKQITSSLSSLRLHNCMLQPHYITLPSRLTLLEVSITRPMYKFPNILNSDGLESLSRVKVYLNWYRHENLPSIENLQYFIWSLPKTLDKFDFEIGKPYKKAERASFNFGGLSFTSLVGLVELNIEILNVFVDCNLTNFPKTLKKLKLNVFSHEIQGQFPSSLEKLTINLEEHPSLDDFLQKNVSNLKLTELEIGLKYSDVNLRRFKFGNHLRILTIRFRGYGPINIELKTSSIPKTLREINVVKSCRGRVLLKPKGSQNRIKSILHYL